VVVGDVLKRRDYDIEGADYTDKIRQPTSITRPAVRNLIVVCFNPGLVRGVRRRRRRRRQGCIDSSRRARRRLLGLVVIDSKADISNTNMKHTGIIMIHCDQSLPHAVRSSKFETFAIQKSYTDTRPSKSSGRGHVECFYQQLLLPRQGVGPCTTTSRSPGTRMS
jgi:hypothetical protein